MILCDLGLAVSHRFFTEGSDNNPLSVKLSNDAYSAPEIISQVENLVIFDETLELAHANPFKEDIWSLGVCLYYMMFGVYPFESRYTSSMYRKILNGEVDLDYD